MRAVSFYPFLKVILVVIAGAVQTKVWTPTPQNSTIPLAPPFSSPKVSTIYAD